MQVGCKQLRHKFTSGEIGNKKPVPKAGKEKIMKNLGEISDPKDIVTKEYVDQKCSGGGRRK